MPKRYEKHHPCTLYSDWQKIFCTTIGIIASPLWYPTHTAQTRRLQRIEIQRLHLPSHFRTGALNPRQLQHPNHIGTKRRATPPPPAPIGHLAKGRPKQLSHCSETHRTVFRGSIDPPLVQRLKVGLPMDMGLGNHDSMQQSESDWGAMRTADHGVQPVDVEIAQMRTQQATNTTEMSGPANTHPACYQNILDTGG